LTALLPPEDNSPMTDRDVLERELRRVLETLKTKDAKFLFDREGRPGAIAAVRGALPHVERELFDAVMEDCECEFAALREALFQIAGGGQGRN
jgi:hypothetical protein